ncbi:MAG: helix-turn-helix domain-containing protein [Proteobacteria bacterium]|nr:helix-turn-helix domain-containing protein [Pseudomonadota bacterium]
MPRLSAESVITTATQRDELHALVRKQTSPQHYVTHARIILLAAEGVGVHETMRRLGLGRSTVQYWRKRWQESKSVDALARLKDRPRSGAPAIYTPEQICSIIALACEQPQDCGRPITHWTQQEFADEAIQRGIAEYVSQRSVGRFLKGGQLATTSNSRLVNSKTRCTI